jgi:nicotinate-nucleotide adenylyltransferase
MIGIYGGTFDPIHYGHLRCAVEIAQTLNLQRMLMIPCRQPVHRVMPGADAEHRYAMLQLALQGQSVLQADRRELDRSNRPSYMVETLAELRRQWPNESFVLCMGNDAFAGIQRWHCWQDLFDQAHILVMTRPGYQHPPLCDFLQQHEVESAEQLKNQAYGGLYFMQVTALDISATAIRRMLEQGGNPHFLLPECVIDYIHQHQLYRSI